MSKMTENAVQRSHHAARSAVRICEMTRFGSFGLNYHSARNARNPKSGEKVLVPPKNVPHFKAGKDMRDRVEASMKQVLLRLAAEKDRTILTSRKGT